MNEELIMAGHRECLDRAQNKFVSECMRQMNQMLNRVKHDMVEQFDSPIPN